MSIQLTKRAEKVGIVLAKRGLTKIPPIRVGVAFDVSGSTQGMFRNGVIQETFDRLLAVALKFDDNGELDAWTFDNNVDQLETASAADEGKFITEHVMNNSNIHKWGGTSYAPCLQEVTNFYFGPSTSAKIAEVAKGFFGGLFGKKAAPAPAPVAAAAPVAQLPAMLLFVTDGSSDDERSSEAVLREAEKNFPGMYYQMIGVGSAHHFTYLERMADALDNVGFVNLTSLSMTDEQLYEALITDEVTAWIKKQ